MKHILTLFIIATVCTSCSTAFKAAQTPDDVYFSPTKVKSDNYQTASSRDRYQENINYQDDRFLRMKVRNQNRWNQIDDFNYWYDSRYDYMAFNNFNNGFNNQFGFNNGFNNGFNQWNGFNTFNTFNQSYGFGRFGNNNCFSPNYFGYGGIYSPIYPVVYYRNPKVYSGVTGKSNLGTYLNTRYNNSNTNYNKGDARNDNFGNMVRRVLAPPQNGNNNVNNSNNSYDRPARTTNSTSAPSNSAGGRSGGYNSSGSSSSSSRPPRK